MSEDLPQGTTSAAIAPLGAYPPSAYAKAVPAGLNLAPTSTWRRWFLFTAAAGVVVGVIWWLAAPGGAFYGEGKDYTVWFPRDLVLGGLGVVAGLFTALVLLRAAVRRGHDDGSTARFVAAIIGALLGSVIAWRIGVFAGDLFQKPPENMPNPSLVFSLRSPSVLLLWPLSCAVVVFVARIVGYLFHPAHPND